MVVASQIFSFLSMSFRNLDMHWSWFFCFILCFMLELIVFCSSSCTSSLTELQVNYNNERSRWSTAYFTMSLILLIFVVVLLEAASVVNITFICSNWIDVACRDFTNPSLPSEQRGSSSQVSFLISLSSSTQLSFIQSCWCFSLYGRVSFYHNKFGALHFQGFGFRGFIWSLTLDICILSLGFDY